MKVRLLAASIAPYLLVCASMRGQQGAASLTGQVSDASGAAVPGAQVTIIDPTRDSKATVVTNEAGIYTVPQLAPGDHYQITVSKDGFKLFTQRDVSLQIAQAAKIDITMQVGSTSDVIEVSAEPPQLDTQTSSLGQVITGQTVADLPLNGRSTFRLIALTPGVTFSQSAYGQFGDVPVNSTYDTNFTINGGRAQSNEILIDGVPSSAGFFDQITTLPIIDETQEFKVQSNNLPAQYGRYSGGVINVTTKSGTNDLHGNLYDFVRNSAFDANEWFQKHNGLDRVPFRMNQFGVTVGGPIRIPWLYNGRNKSFFFFAFQGTRRLRGASFTTTVPTAAQRTGDFRVSPLVGTTAPIIYDPATTTAVKVGGTTQESRTPFPNQQIPVGRLDPVALKLLQYYPMPNVAGTSYNYRSNAPLIVHQNIPSVRIDQNVTDKYHLSGRYEYSSTPLTQPNTYGNVATTGAGAVGTTNFTNQSFAFNNLYVLSPSFLINANYGFARWYQSRKTLSYGFDNASLGFPASFVSSITIPMFPAISIGQYGGMANQSFLNNGNDSHAILISATKILGRHTLTVGVDERLHRINFFNVNNSAGAFTFAKAQTGGPNASATNTAGDGFASFLLGFGSSGTMPIGSGVEMQNFYSALYAQDDFRLTSRLTLNLGVRYDYESPYKDRRDELNYFDPNVVSPARNPSFPGLTGGLVFANSHGRNVYNVQKNGIVPRIGFAYSPHSTTTVRGGFGMSYAPLETSNNPVGFSPSLGYASTTSWNTSNDGGFTPANTLSNPYPQGLVQPSGSSLGAGTQLGQAITVWSSNPKSPYALQWNFDVQQQLPSSILLDIGYAGSRGVHLTSVFDRNTLDPKYLSLKTALTTPLVSNPFAPFVTVGALASPTITQRQLLLPFPQFGSVQEVNNTYGESTYHSLQTKLVKRMSNGVTVLVSYTWSKLISNVNAQNAAIGTTDNTGVQNYYDLRAERAVSELDQPHNLVVNTVYELPFGHGKRFLGNLNPVMNGFVRGWMLTGILTEQSGFPLTFSSSGVGAGNRPDPVPGVDPVIHGSRSNQLRTGACGSCDGAKGWFNRAAFTQPVAYSFGHIGRTYTAIRGPGMQNFDASLQKDTKIGGFTTQLRAEFFNVTNTPHFSQPDTNVQDNNFGYITSTVSSPPEREIQFAIKIAF